MAQLVATYTPGSNRSDNANDWGVQFAWTGPTGSSVTQLGVNKATGNTSGFVVRLINVGNTSDLATATIDLTSGTVGQFTYASVTPVSLVNGTTYQLVVHVPTGQNLHDTGAVTMTNASSIGGRFSVPASGGGGGSGFGTNNMYAGLDLTIIPPVAFIPGRSPFVDLRAASEEIREAEIYQELLTRTIRRYWLTSPPPPVPQLPISWRNQLTDPRFIEYEAIRDLETYQSLLVRRMRGPSVIPLIPAGVGASKFVQYVIITSPQNAISAAKFVQYVVTIASPALSSPPPMLRVLQGLYAPGIEDDPLPISLRLHRSLLWAPPNPPLYPSRIQGLRLLLANQYDENNEITPFQIQRIIKQSQDWTIGSLAVTAPPPGLRLLLSQAGLFDEQDVVPPEIARIIRSFNRVKPGDPSISSQPPGLRLLLMLSQIEEELERSPDQIRQLIKLKMLTSASLFYHQYDQVIWMG